VISCEPAEAREQPVMAGTVGRSDEGADESSVSMLQA
jgi:hypothetical protein